MAENSKKNKRKRELKLRLKKEVLNQGSKVASESVIGFNLFGKIFGNGLDRFQREESVPHAKRKVYAEMKKGGKSPEELSNFYDKTVSQYTNKKGILKGGFIRILFRGKEK